MRRERMIQLLTAALLPALMVACMSPVEPEPEPAPTEPPGTGEKLAPVEEVEPQVMMSFPLQVSVRVEGYLPDSCTELDEINKRFNEETKTFDVEITMLRRTDEACTDKKIAFEENIPLDVYGLPAGTYTVDVNGVTNTFTFESDNELEGES